MKTAIKTTIRTAYRRFLSVFTLLSRFPVQGSFERDFSRADFWIPLVAPAVSLAALAGFVVGTAFFNNTILAIIFSILLQYIYFNIFHLDGLMDSADALMPWTTAERRLEILKDPRIGVYGFFAGAICMATRAAALYNIATEGLTMFSLSAQDTILSRMAGPAAQSCPIWKSILNPALIVVFLAAPLAGRLASSLVPLLSKPARHTGLGALMQGFSPWRVAAGAILAFTPLFVWALLAQRLLLALVAAIVVLLAAFSAAYFIASLYKEKLGGFSGDSLGASIELGEIASILIFIAIFSRFGGLL